MKIGIGGVSRAGKSTLARQIIDRYSDKKRVVIHQDDYINAGYDIPQIQERIDWEVPESIDFVRLSYDFKWISENVEIVILEGIFAFYDNEINKMYDKKIFVDLDYEDFISRKTQDKRWGTEPSWYIQHIWNSYQKHKIEILKMDDIIMLKGGNKCIEEMIEFL